MNPQSKIYIPGHRGMAGSAIHRNLEARGYHNLITHTHSELDLTNQQAVNHFFETQRPEYVFLDAAKVGSILADSTYPAEFIYENLIMQWLRLQGYGCVSTITSSTGRTSSRSCLPACMDPMTITTLRHRM